MVQFCKDHKPPTQLLEDVTMIAVKGSHQIMTNHHFSAHFALRKGFWIESGVGKAHLDSQEGEALQVS
jgi:hypothetical protein